MKSEMKLFRTLQEIISDIANGRMVRVLFDKDFMYFAGIYDSLAYILYLSMGNQLILGKASAWKKIFPNLFYRTNSCLSQFDEQILILSGLRVDDSMRLTVALLVDERLPDSEENRELAQKVWNDEVVYLRDDVRNAFLNKIDGNYKTYELKISDIANFFETEKIKFTNEMFNNIKYDGSVFTDAYVVRAFYEYIADSVENSQKVPRSMIVPFVEDKKYRKQMKNRIVEIDEITLSDSGYRRNNIKYHVMLEHNSIYSKQAFFDVLLYCFDREGKDRFLVGSTIEDIQRCAITSNIKLEDYSLITHQKIADITKASKKHVSMIMNAFEELSQTKLIVSFRDANKDLYRYILSPIDGYVKITVNNGHVVQRFKIHDFLMQNMKSFILMPLCAFTNLSKLPIPNRSKQLASDILEYILSKKNTGMAVLDLEDFANIYSHKLIEKRQWSDLKRAIEEILNAMKKVNLILNFERLADGRYRILFP